MDVRVIEFDEASDDEDDIASDESNAGATGREANHG